MMHDEANAGVAIDFPGEDAQLNGVLFTAGAGAPAIVLVPDVHGVSPLYREIAARFRQAGLSTLVLDPYSREGAPCLADMSAVQSWIAALPDARVLGDVASAIACVETRADVAASAVGIVGFCLGGQYALMAACRLDELSACVAFYGMLRHGREAPHKLPPPLATASALRCPLLGLFGADDPLIPASDVAALRAGLERSGQPFDLRTFAGAGHAFVNDRRPDAYRPEAAREAFQLATEFLQRSLATAR